MITDLKCQTTVRAFIRAVAHAWRPAGVPPRREGAAEGQIVEAAFQDQYFHGHNLAAVFGPGDGGGHPDFVLQLGFKVEELRRTKEALYR